MGLAPCSSACDGQCSPAQAPSSPSDLPLALSSFGPHLILPTQSTVPSVDKKPQLSVPTPLPLLLHCPFPWGRRENASKHISSKQCVPRDSGMKT